MSNKNILYDVHCHLHHEKLYRKLEMVLIKAQENKINVIAVSMDVLPASVRPSITLREPDSNSRLISLRWISRLTILSMFCSDKPINCLPIQNSECNGASGCCTGKQMPNHRHRLCKFTTSSFK